MHNTRRNPILRKLCFIFFSILSAGWSDPAWGTLFNDFQTGTNEGWQQGLGLLGVAAGLGPLGAGDFALEIVALGSSGANGKLVFFNTSAEWTGNYTTQGITSLEGVILNNSGQTLSLRAGVDGSGGRFASTSAFSVPSSSEYQPLTGGATLTADFTLINSAFAGPLVQNPTSTSTLWVDGAGSTADIGQLNMGHPNSAGSILRVTNGGAATSQPIFLLGGNSPIAFEVDGAGSSWTTDVLNGTTSTSISVANRGSIQSMSTLSADQLNITSAGTLTAATSVTLEDSDREVAISNSAAVNVGTQLQVLHRQVEVSGGHLSAATSAIAAGARVEVSNSGTWTTSAELTIQGSLEVTSAGVVSAGPIEITRAPGAISFEQTTITSGGRLASSQRVRVGDTTQVGALTVLSGGVVEAAQNLHIGEFSSVFVDGGVLRVDSMTESVPGGSFFTFASGTLQLTSPAGYTLGANNGPLERELGSSVFHPPTGTQLIVDNTLSVPGGTSLTNVGGYTQGGTIHNQGLIVINADVSGTLIVEDLPNLAGLQWYVN